MACTDVQTIQAGNGSKTQFSFDFPYIFKSEIHVYFWNVTTKEYDEKLTTDGTYPWQVTDANPTIVEFTSTAPPSPSAPTDPGEPTVDNVKIRRITQLDDISALFNPGSAIRSDDLNKNFEQLRYAIQEANCPGIPDDVDAYLKEYYWDRFDNTLYSADTWRSDDATIATTASLDQRFQDEVSETFTKAELAAVSNVIPDDDVALPTTGTLKDYVDHVVETDVLVDSTGLQKTATGGQVTIGIAEGSVDLDRIKPADIIVSGEANPNNNTTIATTAKIDDMIDAAITGDIAVDSTGLTITDDGDGTITFGIGSSSVDLDRIKNDDIITYAEQEAASPAAADTNIFTASAAALRFDTFVQTGTPSGSNWETGKTWLQNDDDQTLKIWSGSTWLDVASGGSFRTQDKVIYVDATGGDDSKTGHRISGPKLTIKDAINDINADISTSIKTAGSGYTDGSYTNVPITGGTTGSGLQADITVSGGAITACTVTSTTTLEEYQIGDILSASDSNLGSGGGSGFELEVTGGGDGMTVIVAAGTYQEVAPIQIKRRNVSIIGMALRSCIVHPTVATQGDHADGNHALFELNSGSFVQNLTLTGMQASSSGTNTVDSDLPTRQGWNFAFYNDSVITKSPYIQNCTNFSDSQIDNSDLRSHRPRGGFAGDLSSAPTGGGMLVDGSVPKSTSSLRSMVADSYTHVGLNGPGLLVTNNGYAQCTSSYAFFNKYHIKALNGGQANLAASTTDFGDQALVANGKSTAAIFTSNVDGAASDGDTTFDVNEPAAGTGWFGDTQRPATNMLVTVNSITYPILSAVANTDSEGGSGWTVTISRPDPNNRSTNLGLNGALTDDLAVEFFLRSQIASSGHTMEYVGSGTDYRALPENGGVPDETKQKTELNNGKIWTATTDHNGKFTIGGNQTDDPFFEVDQELGLVTIPEGSIAFNLLSDETPQLGGNLDVNSNEITSASDGDVTINPNGTGNIVLDANVGIGTTSPNAEVSVHSTSQNASVEITRGAVGSEYGYRLFGTNGATNPALTFFDVSNGSLGSERMRIDSSGNVGIGTSSPSQKLHVNGTAYIADDHIRLLLDSGNGRLQIRSASDVTNVDLYGSNGQAYFAGNVGIGTSSPAHPLHVVGTIRATTDFQLRDASNNRVLIIEDASNDARISNEVNGGDIIFRTNSGSNSERLRIDSSGRLLVGTSSTSNPHTLQVQASSGAEALSVIGRSADDQSEITFYENDNTTVLAQIQQVSGYSVFRHRTGYLRFDSGGTTERMRLDSSGRLLVGTTTSETINGDNVNLQIKSTGASAGLSIHRSQDTNSPPNINLALSRAGAVVSNNDPLGVINFFGHDGTDLNSSAAQIACLVDAPPGANDMPGRLVFSTTTDAASSPTERMRIDAYGRVFVGTTVVGATAADEFTIAAAGNCGITIRAGTTDYSTIYFSDATSGTGTYAGSIQYGHDDDTLRFGTDSLERMRIDSSGSVGIGITNPGDYHASANSLVTSSGITLANTSQGSIFFADSATGTGEYVGQMSYDHTDDSMRFITNNSESLRIDSSSRLLIGKTTTDFNTEGQLLNPNGSQDLTRNGGPVLFINRTSDDGTLVSFYQGGSSEGSISVSGSTVSYNGAHLSRWSQLAGGTERTEILRGSVLSNLDEMCEWGDEDNEQLNRMQVSDVEGDRNVSGVFQAWDDDDDTYINDFYCAMTGDFIIRIAQGTTVARGDLLMSAGDGTAKPQDDDIVRSKTIAKVTSTNVSETYSDGSYCVPCVLMAC